MSLRVTWDGALPAGEPMDVVMEDCTSWTPANTVLKAGRELSSWFFKRPSTQRRPSLFSLCSSPRETESYDIDSPMDMDISKQPLNINDLPQEVLGEIFMAYLNAPDSDDSSAQYEGAKYRVSSHLHSSTNPLLLGQVCSTWRAFTQLLPALWCKISVYCPQPQDVQLFARWLERSGEVPLNLTLVDQLEVTQDTTAAIREIFQLALTQSHRWSVVTFHLASDMGDLVNSRHLQQAMSLHSFDLKITRWSEESIHALLQLLYSSQHLAQTKYSMASSEVTHAVISKTPPTLFSNITHLAIDTIAAEDLLPLLPQYSTLEFLSVRVDSPSTSQPLAPTPIILHALKSLHLQHGRGFVPILNALSLPSLKHLAAPNGFASMFSPHSKQSDGWDAVIDLIERSRSIQRSMQLESLTFKARGMDEAIIVRGLSSPLLQSLKSISILSQANDQLIKALTIPSYPESDDRVLGLLPFLCHLKLDDCCSSDGLLTRMLLSRRNVLRTAQVRLKGIECADQDWH